MYGVDWLLHVAVAFFPDFSYTFVYRVLQCPSTNERRILMNFNPDSLAEAIDAVFSSFSIISQTGLSQIVELLLNPFVSVLIGILTIWITRNANRSSTARERVEKVYHPLFIAIEPYLYKTGLSYDNVAPFLAVYYEIESEHSLLISPVLRQEIHHLNEEESCFTTDKYGYNLWFQICTHVSKEYDKLCRQSYLPTRTISYRLSNKQYRSRISMIFVSIWLQLPAIILVTLILGIISPYILLISYCLFFIFLLNAIINEL